MGQDLLAGDLGHICDFLIYTIADLRHSLLDPLSSIIRGYVDLYRVLDRRRSLHVKV